MKKFELNIPKPCHENWETMTPEAKGRFCSACQKTVVDFSVMSDRQVADFFKRAAGSVCGRFSGHQLDRIIEVPRKRIPWVKYFFTISLPAFLLSLKAGAQGEVRLTGKVAVCEKPFIKGDTVVVTNEKPTTSKTITGRVVNESGEPVQGASVIITNTNRGVATNYSGQFKLELQSGKDAELTVSSVGYETLRVNVFGKDSILITLRLAERVMQGEVLLTVGMVVKKKPVFIPVIPPKKTDPGFSKFSVFPNPVERNSSFAIEVKDMEDGRYNMALLTSTGEVVQAKELQVEKKARLFRVQLENVAAAPCYIMLTNKESGKVHTEVILVK